MRISRKLHRPTAIAAAVIMLIELLLNTGLTLNYLRSVMNQGNLLAVILSLATYGGEVILSILMVVILLRGKKDTAAGAIFVVTAIFSLGSMARNLVSILLGFELSLYIGMELLTDLLLMALRILIAVECLSCGKVSGGAMRVVLILLPILCTVCQVAAQVVLCAYSDGMSMGEAISSSLIYMIPRWLGPILMCISFSIPSVQVEGAAE